jgi:hypothetical protein
MLFILRVNVVRSDSNADSTLTILPPRWHVMSRVSMRKRAHTPGLRLDGHCVPDPLCERLAGVLLSALQGKHGGADGEERPQREVLIFDAAAKDDAVDGSARRRPSRGDSLGHGRTNGRTSSIPACSRTPPCDPPRPLHDDEPVRRAPWNRV